MYGAGPPSPKLHQFTLCLWPRPASSKIGAKAYAGYDRSIAPQLCCLVALYELRFILNCIKKV